jgi:Rrf2 family protein
LVADNALRKERIVLDPELPPRIYESLKALCCLAKAAAPLQAHEIASTTGLPPAQTAKILQMMSWAGFVESRRGTKGGFWLVTPAEHIRVTDILNFFAHRTHKSPEQIRDPILQVLAHAMTRCRKELNHITVADLAKLACCEQSQRGNVPKTVVAPATRKLKRFTDSTRQRNHK